MDIYKLMKLLSDPTRMKIMYILFNKPCFVKNIVEYSGQSQANVSKHLKKLSDLNLVTSSATGNKVEYSISDDILKNCYVFQPLMQMYSEHPDGKGLLKKINSKAN